MKIIDLLVKISKGEEVPKKFKDNYHTYELIKYPCCGVELTNYKDEDGDYLFGCEYELMLLLNDEVEIIEEEKEIENQFTHIYNCSSKENIEMNFQNIQVTLKDIIDVINDRSNNDE